MSSLRLQGKQISFLTSLVLTPVVEAWLAISTPNFRHAADVISNDGTKATNTKQSVFEKIRKKLNKGTLFCDSKNVPTYMDQLHVTK